MGFVSREGLERFAERTLEEKEEFFRGRLPATLVTRAKIARELIRTHS